MKNNEGKSRNKKNSKEKKNNKLNPMLPSNELDHENILKRREKKIQEKKFEKKTTHEIRKEKQEKLKEIKLKTKKLAQQKNKKPKEKPKNKKSIIFVNNYKLSKPFKISNAMVNLFYAVILFLISYFIITIASITFLASKYHDYQKFLYENRDIDILRKKAKEEEKRKQEEEKYAKKQSQLTLETINNLSKEKKLLMFELIPSQTPVTGEQRITSPFGTRVHPISGVEKTHTGIDFGAEEGRLLISPAIGEVVSAQPNGGYGLTLVIKHNFGFQTLYAHLSEIMVKPGDIVAKGQVVAKVGNTGVSTGPHLHYEVKYNGNQIDPLNFIEWNEKQFDLLFKNERSVPWQSLLKIMVKKE